MRGPLVLLATLALVLAGCGRDEPVPRSLRLLRAAGTLVSPQPAPERVLWEDDLAHADPPGAGWHVVTSQETPAAPDASLLAIETGTDAGTPLVALSGEGALCRFVPVEPGATLAVRARVRLRDLVPGPLPDGRRFLGATLYVAELAGGTEDERELLGQLSTLERRHVAARDLAAEGWQSLELMFRTTPRTRALAVVLLMTIGEPAAGRAEFAAPQVARVPEAALWEREARIQAAAAWRYDAREAAGDWRARRAVSAMLAAEERPAILLLPGERLRFDLRVPEGEPVLEAGLGPWPGDYRPGPDSTLVCRVGADGALSFPVPRPERARAAWTPALVDLGRHAGRRVTLELAAEGPAPIVLGAPRVVDRGRAPSGAGDWNVVLISLDTLRADRVGAYGHPGDTTPNLDALARESLLFEDAVAQAPYTLPSHATMFSGQYPRVHGVQDRGFVLSPARSPILPLELARRGYATQACTAAGFLLPDFGFHQGFDGFAVVDPLRHAESKTFAALRWQLPDQVPEDFVPRPLAAPLAFLEAHAHEPFFLFVHTYEVHEYDPPPGPLPCAAEGCPQPEVDIHDYLMNPKRKQRFPETAETRHLLHRYDAALRHVDGLVGRLLERLDALGIADRTIVVVTSDHGEEIFDRGHLQHGKTLFEELLRIPLIVRIPGVAPRRVATPAFLVDVAPTILAALGLPPDPRMQGVDLLRAPDERSVWAEVDDHNARATTLRTADGWKLIQGSPDAKVFFPVERECRLHDLSVDPGETDDQAASDPERLARLRAELERFGTRLSEVREALGAVEAEAEISSAAERSLNALGYGSGN